MELMFLLCTKIKGSFCFTGNLGVYLNKDKATPAMIKVHDCLSGKIKNVDVDELAKM